jgi:hypothetical protein
MPANLRGCRPGVEPQVMFHVKHSLAEAKF